MSIGDLAAALYGVIAISARCGCASAIYGAGRHLDIAMLDCQVAWLEDALARYSATGKVPGPLGSRHPSITPFQQFPRGRRISSSRAAGNESIWQRFCDAIGMSRI